MCTHCNDCGHTEQRERDSRWNLVKANNSFDQKIWEQQRLNWIFIRNTSALKIEATYSFEQLVHTVITMNTALSGTTIQPPSMCAFTACYTTKYTFTSTTVRFPTGHYTVRSTSTFAVPGFASWCAAQVSAITALCSVWSRPLGGPRRGALSEEGIAKHWNPSRYYADIIMIWYTIHMIWNGTISRHIISYMICVYLLTVIVLAVCAVDALCYKPEGRGFDSWWCHWNFSSSGRTMTLGLTEPLTEMSTRNNSWR
jgi:hypothetical protein